MEGIMFVVGGAAFGGGGEVGLGVRDVAVALVLGGWRRLRWWWWGGGGWRSGGGAGGGGASAGGWVPAAASRRQGL